MGGCLTVEVHSLLNPLSTEEWRRLFPEYADPLDLLQAASEADLSRISFHSIVVRQGRQPVILLPVAVRASGRPTGLENRLRGLVHGLKALFGLDNQSRGLPGTGSLCAGLDRDLSPDCARQAWTMALETLEALYALMAIEPVSLPDQAPGTLALKNLAVS